jgi:signal transduction histidine kinase/two-component SAPR family response regulator
LTAWRPLVFFCLPVFLFLLALTAVAFELAREEKASQEFVDHTYQVIVTAQAMLTDVQAAELAEREYRLTGTKAYEDRVRFAMQSALKDRDHFQSLTPDNPHQQVRAGALKAQFESLEATIQAALAAPRPPALPTSAATRALTSEIVANVDHARDALMAASAEERALLAMRTSHTRALERSTFVILLLSMFLALATLVGVVVLLARSNLRLIRSESERTHQASILQATLDSIRDGIAVFAGDRRLQAFNPNFFGLADLPLNLAATGTVIDAFREAEGERTDKLFPNIGLSELAALEPRHLVIDGRHLDVYSTTVSSGGVLVAVSDVTARVQFELSSRQAQKMEAIGQLTGGVAHDFNNLLQIISANLDLSKDLKATDERLAVRLNNAIAAVERGSRLTGQLLAFARRQPLAPRVVNIGRLVQEMTDMLRRTLGEPIEIESVTAGGLWNALVDPGQLQNALLNLTINARDAMPDGGQLTIEVANAFLDDDYVSQHAEATAGQYVMLAVTDTGCGMAPGVVARAFDPFFTTKPEGQGTGLGLSQVYGFVKQSGGHIKIYSEVGDGTTVKLYLPRTRKAQDDVHELSDGPLQAGSESILVVEDDEGVRAAVTDLLAELGYRVLKADGAERALAVLRSGVKVDLLFSDVVMPGPIPTREMARIAAEIDPAIKILFTSGYTQNAIVHNGKLDDGVFLLSKPYRKHELARKLRTLLERSEPESQQAPSAVADGADSVQGSAKEHARKPKKALVVDDVALVRMSTADMVGELGLEVAEAGTGQEALDLLASDEGIDLLVTDLGLPNMSGAELIRLARQQRPALAVLVISGYARDAGPHQGVPDDAKFLMKPFTADQLTRAILED